MLFSMGIFRPLSLGDSISSDAERTVLGRQGEQPGYIQVLQQRAGTLNVTVAVQVIYKFCNKGQVL